MLQISGSVFERSQNVSMIQRIQPEMWESKHKHIAEKLYGKMDDKTRLALHFIQFFDQHYSSYFAIK